MIYFDDWLLMMDAGPVIARQYDNLTRRLEILGQFPEGWDWTLLVQADKHLDIIALAPMEGGMGVDLTAEMLALSGYYTVQLKGVQGELVRHTNQVRIFIPDSLSGDANWPEVPSEFSQAEARIRELNEHPPYPGDAGYWMMWDLETDAYIQSSLPLPPVAEGPPGKAATIKVGETVTGDPDTPAAVENIGTENAAVLRFTIPRGAVGPTGATPAISAEVTGLPAGSEPTVEVSGTPEKPVISLGIPQGKQGDPGGKGDPGDPGQTPNITIGQVETLPAESPVTASITGQTPNLVLNLGIPEGKQGEPGQAATIEIVETETVAPDTPAAMVELPDSTPQARRYKAQVPQGPAGIGLPALSGPEDAGKVPVVNKDGTGWLLGSGGAGGLLPRILVYAETGAAVTAELNGVRIDAVWENSAYVLNIPEYGVWSVKVASAIGNVRTFSVSVDTVKQYFIEIENDLYGVEWAGGISTAMSRTDDAFGFTDPVTASGTGAGSSPFDEIYPWKDMQVTEDPEAGSLVSIPVFWYLWTTDGTKLKLQISPTPRKGFFISPAHADRGDGKGERNVVYVGRYHCADTYKSKAGKLPVVGITRQTARSSIHALGQTIYQWDWAINFTIKMLYLVEYASWSSQDKIGYGGSPNARIQDNGATDAMIYHTGSFPGPVAAKGITQYRHIEGLWDNVYDWLDGCYVSDSNFTVVSNPEEFSDASGGLQLSITSENGYPSKLSMPVIGGQQYAYPIEFKGNHSSYINDTWNMANLDSPCVRVGGDWNVQSEFGLFHGTSSKAGDSFDNTGCRLQKLP